MEDSHVPVLLRDTQVTSIWEGTTNVLAHDVWRPILKQNALPLFIEETKNLIGSGGNSNFAPIRDAIDQSLVKIRDFALKASKDTHFLESHAREFAFSMARTFICALLTQHALATNLKIDFAAASRFASRGLFLVQEEPSKLEFDRLLAMDVDEKTGTMRGVGDGVPGALRARY